MGNELHSKKHGKKKDHHLHKEILNNSKAEHAVAKAAVIRAMKKYNLTFKQAEALYGYRK